MALKTQGFALSEMPRPVNVPGNIGVVDPIDVKAIYDGVKTGLSTIQTAALAPRSMALADAQMQAQTAQAPLGTRLALAQTEGAEQQTPLKTQLLAEEASPEMMAAKRQALLNRNAKAPSGIMQAAMALTSAQRRLADDPMDAEAALLVANLQPIVTRGGASSLANPQGVIDAGADKAQADNAAKLEAEAGKNKRFEDALAAQNQRFADQETRIRELAAALNTSRETIAGGSQEEVKIRNLRMARDEAAASGDTDLTADYDAMIKKRSNISSSKVTDWSGAFGPKTDATVGTGKEITLPSGKKVTVTTE